MSSQRTHVAVRDMPVSGYVDGVYTIVNPQVGTTRAGKPYLKCLLKDATGEMPGRKWEFNPAELGELQSTGFVWVSGNAELYEERPQLRIDQIKSVEVSEEDLVLLVPSTRRDIEAMFQRVCAILRSLSHPGMLSLAETFLGDEAIMANFRRAPAAVSVHHAWIGGLLEHTLQVMELAERMLPLYPQLDRDIVLMGLFLHDLGKCWELSWERGFNYTADGNLVGHIVRGAIVLQFKAAQANKASGSALPAAAVRVLQHIILSHHGSLEFGAAKLPSTPEAVFIAGLDNLDAKTQCALDAVHGGAGSGAAGEGVEFTDRIWALDTRLYRGQPLK
jgi:3'-5' exoribonuclease